MSAGFPKVRFPADFRVAAASAEAGAWDWDISGARPLWSPQTFDQFGLNPAGGPPTFREWLERCVHPEDRQHCERYHDAVLNSEETALKIEYRIVHPERGIRWIATRGRIYRDAGGKPVRINGLNFDITEQKEIEEKLRQSEERLALALEASGMGVWEWTPSNDAISWSKEVYGIMGVTRFEGTRDGFFCLVHPEDAERVRQTFTEALSSCTNYAAEFRVIGEDGETRWVCNTGRATYGPGGEPVRVLGTITDITRRKRAELSLAEREMELRLFVDNAPAAIAMFDNEMRYIAVSRRFAEEYGLPHDLDLAGRSHYEMLPDLPQRWRDVHKRVLAGEEVSANEDLFLRSDGRRSWQRWSMRPWHKADGAVGGALLFTETVTEQVEARRKLAESEERFRAAFENAAADVAQVAPDGAWLHVNKRLCGMLGYRAEELLTKKFQQVTHPEDLNSDLANVQRMLDGEIDTYSMEKRYLRKDGSIVWARLTAGCKRKADRTIDYFVSVVEDISEQKRTQEELRSNKELFEGLAETLPGIVFVSDARGQNVYTNSFFQTFSGFTAKALLNAGWIETLHPDDRKRSAETWQHAVRTGEPYEIEYRFRRRDGAHRWFMCRGLAQRDPHSGQIVRWVGVAIDIDDRRHTEERLRQSEARLATALRAGKLGVYDYDPRSGYMDWDATLRHLWGVPEDEIVTIDTFEAGLHPEDLAPVRAAIRRSFNPEGTRHYEAEYRVVNRADGTVRWVFADGDVFFEGDKPCRLVGIAQDITERKQVQEALRQSEAQLRYALKAASAGIWDWDILADVSVWSPEDYVLYDRDPADGPITYDDWQACLHPADREAATLAVSRALAGDVPEYRSEFRVVHRDDTVRWLLALGQVERAADGTPLRMSGINLDITERKLAEEALRASEDRYRGIFQNAGTGIAIADFDGRFQSCNPAYASMLGYSLDELQALSFPDLMHPEDRDKNLAEIRRLIAQEIPSFEIVNRYTGKSGKPIWVHKHVSLLRGSAGKPASIISLFTDISERKQQEEQINLLLREVTHRAKNILSLVQAIAWHTAAKTPQDFVSRFNERIAALAASQDLLVTGAWNAADLGQLIRSQLAHFRDLIGTRIGLQGPAVSVSASAAQALGMAVHELATNAGKYGALSNTGGRVDIFWGVEQDGREETFAMKWIESGGPPVKAPAQRGFGSTVIGRMAEASLNAKVELNFDPAGVTWQLRCLAKAVME